MSAAPRRPHLPRLRWWQIDGLVVALLIAEMVLDAQSRVLVHGQRHNDFWMYALAVVMAVPYLTHRRWPLTSVAVTCAAVVVFALATYAPFPGLSVFLVLFGVSLHSDRRKAGLAFVAALVTLTIAIAVQPAEVPDQSTVVSTFSVTAVAWLVGENLRHRRARWLALEERAALLERERDDRTRQAVTDERLRIARELHDVVAHAMSVIAVQSGVGNHVIDSQPAEAKRALAAIETTSRDALTEMRRLLGVLRQEGEHTGASLEPAPGVGDLGQLLSQVGVAGLDATLTIEGEVPEVPAAVGLSAYRIVQEALTNALRHGGPHARVTVRFTDNAVTLEVVDDGRTGADGLPVLPADGSGPGHGLIGMRERVAVFGGELRAGPRPGGGFQVSARLPLAVRP